MNRHFIFRFAAVRDQGPDIDRLVVFVAGRRFDSSSFIEDVTNEINKRLLPDELIILGRETVMAEARSVAGGREFARLLARLTERVSITAIGVDHTGTETSRTALRNAIPSDAPIDNIWRRGGTEIFDRRGGFVESTNAFHFANPSGKHTNRFIRLSNILVVHAEIEFVAASTMHLIDQTAEHVYIDTPSLFAVVAALNDIRSTEGSLPPLTCDSFRSYDGVEKQAFDYPKSAVLISASSSGSLAKRIAKRGMSHDQITHILYLGRDAVNARCAIDLGLDLKLNPDGHEIDRVEHASSECRMCAVNSHPVALRGDQFDIAGPQPKPLTLTQTGIPKNLHGVMTSHVGTGVFGIGGAESASCQLDAKLIYSSPEGSARRDYVLDLHVPANAAAVITADDASRDLAGHVARRVSTRTVIETFSEFEQRCAPSSDAGPPIVIVQSIVGSGRSIIDISRDLRRWPATPLVYIIGFLATESEAKARALISNLSKTWNHVDHRVTIIDQLSLPPKGEPNAWEAEAKLLDVAASNGLLKSAELISRRAKLSQLAGGLFGEIFHTSPAGRPLQLNPGFVFWPDELTSRPTISQADVFVTISSILQGLRAADKGKPASSLTTAWYYSTVLDPENFGRFNDGIIQASLLRAARPSELDYRDNPAASSDAARLLRRILTEPETPRGDAAREFAIALATERLRLLPEHREELLSIRSADAVLNEILGITMGLSGE